jgi:hypothetical protein
LFALGCRFNTLVRLMQQDTLRSLAEDSVAKFVAFMQARGGMLLLPLPAGFACGRACCSTALEVRSALTVTPPCRRPAPQACCTTALVVRSTSQVDGSELKAGARAPLLVAELLLAGGDKQIVLSTPLDHIQQRIMAAFDRALTKLQVPT